MKQALEYLLVKYEHPIVINCDNTSAINMSKNPFMHSKTKHIPIKYHFLRDQLSQKAVKLEYVYTKEHIADIFTKPPPKESFEHLRKKMGVISLQSIKRRKRHHVRGRYVHGGSCQKEFFVINVKVGEKSRSCFHQCQRGRMLNGVVIDVKGV